MTTNKMTVILNILNTFMKDIVGDNLHSLVIIINERMKLKNVKLSVS